MCNHHPDISTLTEFSAGVLPPAVSACVAAHLEFCVQCRSQVAKLDSIGGELLQSAPAVELTAAGPAAAIGLSANDAVLDQVFAKIDALQADNPVQSPKDLPGSNTTINVEKRLPAIVKRLIHSTSAATELKWSKLSASLSVARLFVGDNLRELALQRLKSGGGVANHNHRAEEITVVLCGSFSDQNGIYMPGDFLVRQPGEIHSPRASADGDCICLSAMAAPVKFTGLLTRLINPFLKVSPSAR